MWTITIHTEDGPLSINRLKEDYPTKMELELHLRMTYGKYTKWVIVEEPILQAFVPGKSTVRIYRDIDGNGIPTSKYYHHSFGDETSEDDQDEDLFDEMYP